ncbi:MAG TPA: hypothetical protein VKB14_12260 [Actinomycetales bacterium]|nr:hypothetical protein [Actinomycetales bacterium]
MGSVQLPADLVAQALWAAPDDEPEGRAIVFATERRRRRLVLWAGPVAAALALLAWSQGAPAAECSMASLVVFVISAAIMLGGRTGYYVLDAQGRPEQFLGRHAPDLSGRRRYRISARRGQ